MLSTKSRDCASGYVPECARASPCRLRASTSQPRERARDCTGLRVGLARAAAAAAAVATGNSGSATYHVHTAARAHRHARDRARVRGSALGRMRSRATPWETCAPRHGRGQPAVARLHRWRHPQRARTADEATETTHQDESAASQKSDFFCFSLYSLSLALFMPVF